MPTSIVRLSRLRCAPLLAVLFLQWLALPAVADERTNLHAAATAVMAQYQIVLNSLETRGRDENAAQVALFRAAVQDVIERFNSNRAVLSGDRDYADLFVQVDNRILGAMIVINTGSSEAARNALAPIGETLSELSARSAPPKVVKTD